MKVVNNNRKVEFPDGDQGILEQNPRLREMCFAPYQHQVDDPYIRQLQERLGIVFPELFLEFTKQCGGFDAGVDYGYPCALGDMTRSLLLPFSYEFERRHCRETFTLFDGFFLPSRSGHFRQVMEVLADCFVDDCPEGAGGREVSKLIPFAADNNTLLCLDFNVDGPEPAIAFVEYDTPGVHLAFASFRELLLNLTY